MHGHMYVYTHVCIYVCVRPHAHKHMSMHAYTHTHTCTSMRAQRTHIHALQGVVFCCKNVQVDAIPIAILTVEFTEWIVRITATCSKLSLLACFLF